MTERTVSVRAEVVVTVDSAADLAAVIASLEDRVHRAVDNEPATRTIYHVGTVTRRPGPNEAPLR